MADLRELTAILLLVSVRAGFVAFDKLYEDGVVAYTQKNWEAAILNIEQALQGYKGYVSGLSSCSINCSSPLHVDSTYESIYLNKIFTKGLCVKLCLTERFGDFKVILRLSREVLADFENYMPYQYLQFAYYQNNMLSESVSAAYTYHLKYPEDELMSTNIQIFQESEDVTSDMFVDREAKDHVVKYNSALEAYLKEEYLISIELFEEALEKYFDAADNCYGICEGREAAGDEQWKVGFYLQNAYHYIDVMECSLHCIRDLLPNGRHVNDFLPLIFHHLQYAYYQLHNFSKSANYMLSYLLFHPNSTDMTENLSVLGDEFNITHAKAPEKVLAFHQKVKLLSELLQYSWNYFGMKDKERGLLLYFQHQSSEPEPPDDIPHDSQAESPQNEESGYENMKEKTDDIISKRAAEIESDSKRNGNGKEHQFEPLDDVDIKPMIDSESHIGYKVVDSKYVVTIPNGEEGDPFAEGPLMFKGATLLANSSMLKGSKRFAIDGLASESQCQDLIDFTVGHGKLGDGYQGKESPHTKHEKFNGVTVLDAALAAKAGDLPPSVAKLYYDLSEKVRIQVQAYFHLPHLYFDFTHLVCRTSTANSPANRNDLSHPVHADNCLLQKNASCIKEPPAYVWRDYSAILYLNGDFDGGEFIFTDSTARRVRVNLKPQCGRMVSFSAGKDSLHGVKPVLHGRRCAIALWFTLSESKKEARREIAKDIIDQLMMSLNEKVEL